MAVETGRRRAPFAADPAASRGRLYPEPSSATRNAYRRDCDRIIHSAAFRRLKYKTQVFVFHEGDHYRTRLTHSLEVAQVARSLARALGLDEDLAEALALAHDLGHPPFGHAGERALDECLAGWGGFDHNAQTLRVVTLIERRYPDFDGLNLSWETLEGLIKHNGPLTERDGRPAGPYRTRGLPGTLPLAAASHDLMLWSHASAEAQVAAVADDIAYNAHDIDDGLRAELFALDDLGQVPLVEAILGEIRARYPVLDPARRVHELIRRLIGRLIEDVIAESDRRFEAIGPRSSDDVRTAGRPLVGFSGDMSAVDAAVKRFLSARMYRHARVSRILSGLWEKVRERPEEFLDRMTIETEGLDAATRDFIAGMTDRYALIEHARHFDSTPELV